VNSIVIPPLHTELKSIEDKLGMLKGFSFLPLGEKPLAFPDNVFIDFTFDFFDQEVSSFFLIQQAGLIIKILEEANFKSDSIVVLRSYPFRTNINKLILKQRILDKVMEILEEFFNIRIFFLPTIISRNGFSRSKNPALRLINSMRIDKPASIEVKDISRFFLIYEMDIIDFFSSHFEKIHKNRAVIEGLELTLGEIHGRAIPVTGETSIQFNQHNFIHFEYPMENSETIRCLNYELEDMLMDITSFLF